ncbi:hypothetical protein [Halococcus salsus]|uniref:hypothetical protein n=1 Tax=Halococcus salsus TaxID=2162894 RepID=UPI00135A6C83|nr:hypothetical protein [Halococcus salsus]
MDLTELLSSPVVGNIIVLLAAIIGVGGSYLIYRLRIKRRKSSARRAIRAELESMTFFPQWVDDDSRQPPTNSIGSTTAYESHAENIGLLQDVEVDSLTKFYSSLEGTDKMLATNTNLITQTGMSKSATDSGRQDRENVLKRRIDQLAVWRWQALQILRKRLGEEYKPPEYLDIPESSEDKIHAKHPVVRMDKKKDSSNRYFEPIDDDSSFYRLTEHGEQNVEKISDQNVGFDNM